MSTPPWPTELRVDPAKTVLTVSFDNDERFDLSAEYLRVESPSVEVQGHGTHQKQIVPGKRQVKIEALEAVGNYAVRIRFDDGHDTGLFSWEYLLELGRKHASKWQTYLGELRRRGESRG